MPTWLTFLIALIKSAASAFVATWRQRMVDFMSGAERQRQTQDTSDAEFAKIAEERRNEWAGLEPEEIKRRLRQRHFS